MRYASRLLPIAVLAGLAPLGVALASAERATGGAQPVHATPAGASVPGVSGPAGAGPAAIPATGADAARKPSRRRGQSLIVRVRPGHQVDLHTRPGGPIGHGLTATTDFGSTRTLGVVRRRGRWLGVTTETLPNGRLGWVDSKHPAVSLGRTRWSLHADMSRRRVLLRRDGRVVRRVRVAVGRSESPTPTGRFAVTDKLAGERFGPYYGCCILAISATQPNLPAGWTGGDRMAIHGADTPGSIGTAASAGCLRAGDSDLGFLMRRVPLGTPVVIRR